MLAALERRGRSGRTHTRHMTTSSRNPVARVARVVAGWVVLAVGVALLVLPGPGLLVIAGGLLLLSTEYAWAARLLDNVRRRIAAVRNRKNRDAVEESHP